MRQEKGAVAVPEDFIEVSQFPETRSGKYMRRMVRALVEGADVGDTSALRNPESIPELRQAIDEWLARQRFSAGHLVSTRTRLDQDLLPHLGALPVREPSVTEPTSPRCSVVPRA